MREFFETGDAGISFHMENGRIRAVLTIGEERVSPARFLRRVPGATLLHSAVRSDDTVCCARFAPLYRHLTQLARTGALEVYAPPGLRSLNELSVPMGFALHFALDRPARRLCVTCSEKGYRYDGQGCFLGPGGFFRLPRLEALDPITEDVDAIPPRNFNLFLRILLPSLQKQLPATCDIRQETEPPVRLTVTDWGQTLKGSAKWRIPFTMLQDAGCAGACLAGDALLPGDLATYASLPCRWDGTFALTGEENALLRKLAITHPQLFEGPPAPPPAAETLTPSVRSEKIHTFDGPALKEVRISPAHAALTGKNQDFLSRALQWASRRDSYAPYVPFQSYWPSYSLLSPGQLNYYFYWRGRVMEGEYPDRCDAYVYLYAFELINGIHEGNAAEKLLALWKQYRSQSPRLDAYMADWLLDLWLINGEGTLTQLTDQMPTDAPLLALMGEIFFSDRLKEGVSALPPRALMRIAGFDAAKSQVPPEKLCLAVKGLEAWHAANGKTLLEAYRPQPVTVTRESFRGALKGRRLHKNITVTYYPYFRQKGLVQELNTALKYGENFLRAQLHLPGRLKADKLPQGLTHFLDDALLEKDTPSALSIDVLKAQSIESDSWDVTKKLIVDEEPEPAPLPAVPVPTVPEPQPPENTIEFTALIAQLDEVERAFLAARLREEDAVLLCANAFRLPDSVAEHINELAADLIGDSVLDAGDLTVYPDYAEALLQALDL